jgi:acetyl esterase/lipase
MKILLTILFATGTILVAAQKVIPVYTDGKIPGSIDCNKKEVTAFNPANNRETVADVMQPSLTVYQPAMMNVARSAVIICPGGGYARLAITHEGYQVAEEMNKAGITAFVLKYRLPNDTCMQHKETAPLQDIQQAMILVKSHAADWGIDSSKVGVLGFSAGGHLASTAATHFTTSVANNPLGVSVRPAFAVLVYPVISFTNELAHAGSRDNLLGKNATEGAINLFSNEKQVTAQTPPCFLVHAADDRTVPVKNSIRFYEALLENKVKGSLLIYQSGGHGFGLVNPDTKETWMPNAVSWLKLNGF